MKFPLSWLKKYLPTKLNAKQVAEALTSIGLEIESVTETTTDPIFELSLTPNLVHCASLRGVARELSAITQEPVTFPTFNIIEDEEHSSTSQISVTVENPVLCPRYSCRVITGIHVAPSPEWLQKLLDQCGIRSVNNIVDITNFVLHELGHPLHAFDLDTLEESRIVVRTAKHSEKITTLDGIERYPTEECLLICDGKKSIAIAGVMGSLSTEVSEKTTRILLEAAYFEPTQVRRSSKRLGLSTEASYHFERGADPNGTLEALDRAAQMIIEIAGGTALQGAIDIADQKFLPHQVSCRLSRINQILGIQLSMSEVDSIFRRLSLSVDSIQGDTLTLSIPTYRHDLFHEIDLIEEVARLYGYDNIRTREKSLYRSGSLPHSSAYLFEKQVRDILLKEGLQEFLTCDLISPYSAALVSPDCMPKRSLIQLLNPHSNDQSVLRPSLLPGMLHTIKYNADHQIFSVAGFEVGRIHFKVKDTYLEPTVLSVVLTGERFFPNWEKKSTLVDFFDLKGMIENLLAALKIDECTFISTAYENFHPGRQCAILASNGSELGIMGEVHPLTLKKIDINRPVYFAEINLEDLKRLVPEESKMVPLPQYPATWQDWTVSLQKTEPVQTVFDLIKKSGPKLLETVTLKEIYEDEKLGDWKNVTFRFTYRDHTKTISDDVGKSEHDRICASVMDTLKKESKVKI